MLFEFVFAFCILFLQYPPPTNRLTVQVLSLSCPFGPASIVRAQIEFVEQCIYSFSLFPCKSFCNEYQNEHRICPKYKSFFTQHRMLMGFAASSCYFVCCMCVYVYVVWVTGNLNLFQIDRPFVPRPTGLTGRN